MKRIIIVSGIIAIVSVLRFAFAESGLFSTPLLDKSGENTEILKNKTVQDPIPEENELGAWGGIKNFWNYTGFTNVTLGHIAMIIVGLFFIFLAIKYDYEPLLLIPIGTGILIGNIPFVAGFQIGIYEDGSVLNYLYYGVLKGVYPTLPYLFI